MSLFEKKNYSVKILGRASTVVYSEGGKEIRIDSEMLIGDEADIVIYLSSIGPDDLIKNGLSGVDIRTIQQNISAELKRMKILWE